MKKLLLTFILFQIFGNFVSNAQNLIPNGGFESGSGNSFTNWWFGTGGGNAIFSEETTDVMEGTRALKVEVITPGANPWDVQAINDAWPSVAGEEYTLSFWAKAATAGSSFKAVMQTGGAYAENVITLTETWEKYEWTFVAEANGLEFKLHFPNAGTFYIDGASIPGTPTDPSGPPNQVELVLNGDFEEGSGDEFTHWWFGTGNGTANFTEETNDVQQGNRALKVEVIALGDNPWDIQAVNDPWPSVAGETYTLSFWAKAAVSGGSFRAVMQIGNFYDEKAFTVTDTWAKYEWNFTAATEGLELKFQFLSTGTFYIDNVSIPGQIPTGEGEVVILEAESGTVVAESDPPVFQILQEGNIEFIRVMENFVASQFPGTESRMITYSVEFPAAGIYDLYVRMRVGAGGFDDDSFFYGNDFGLKSADEADDWIMVNGLSPVGFDEPDQIVSEGGTAGNQVWKWLKLSSFSGQGATGIQFEVPEGQLTQIFQIGSRENGFDIDKFAFGTAGVFFTVDNLDKGEGGTTVPPPPPYTPTGPPIAEGHEKFLGNIYSNAQIPHFTNYWNQVTPENAGKWGSVEGTRDVMNWTQLDAAYELAKENGFPFRFHVLIWGNQQPTWLSDLPPAEQLEEIKEWFAAVAERYPDMDYIEVVNEPISDPPVRQHENDNDSGNYLEALGGTGETGWDWVLNSFRLAREYFPNTKLMINEYSVENETQKAQTYLQIIQLLQQENLIDLIGIQGHAFSTRAPSATLESNLNLLASSGLPIQVTELDIDGTNDQVQLADYQRIFPIYWEHPSVTGITLWGWKPGMWRTSQGAYLALENGAERPALVWLREYVESTKTRNTPPTIVPSQSFAVDGGVCNVIGLVEATDPDNNTTLSNWQIVGGNGASIFAVDASTGEISIANPSLLNFREAGYTLTLTVSDGVDTSDAEDISITIPDVVMICHKNGKNKKLPKQAAPAQLKNGGCLGTCGNVTASITDGDYDSSGINVYPNPVQGQLNIALGINKLNIKTLELYDLSGRRLMEMPVNGSSDVSISCEKLKPNLYLLRMVGDQVINRKIMLE